MIEFVNEQTCTNCNRCVEVCPTNVLELGVAVPVVARLHECTSCMNCELYCPTDSIYVSPIREPEVGLDRDAIIAAGMLGSYRRAMNWEDGRAPSGTGDNWALQLREHRPSHPPNVAGDRDADIRMRLYHIRDRNLIPVE